MVRVPESLAKIDRIKEVYQTKVKDTPKILFDVLEEQRKRLLDVQKEHGDYITPDKFA